MLRPMYYLVSLLLLMHATLAKQVYNNFFVKLGHCMNYLLTSLLPKLRFLVAGIYVVVCLFMLSLLVSAITGKSSHASAAQPVASISTDSMPDSANAVSNGMTMALDEATNTANRVVAAVSSSSQAIAAGIAGSGKAITHAGAFVTTGAYHGVAAAVSGIGHGALFVGSGIGHGILFVGRGVGSGMLFVVRIPGSIVSSIGGSAPVSAVIRPSEQSEQEPVPVIDPASPDLAKAKAALAAAKPSPKAPAAPQSIWPIHGAITTEFGVPEPPYQPIHTGIDISDGEPSGITPVKAFRAGRVIDVEHSGGLGNHVVVDHGSGVTSVYGHLYSIAVSVGQEVDTTTTLGLEGTTGVSTGPHVHFEVRVNGAATNPHDFVPGHP